MPNLTPSTQKLTLPYELQTADPATPLGDADSIIVDGDHATTGNAVSDHISDIRAKLAHIGTGGNFRGEYAHGTSYAIGDEVYWIDGASRKQFYIRLTAGQDSAGNPSTIQSDWDLATSDLRQIATSGDHVLTQKKALQRDALGKITWTTDVWDDLDAVQSTLAALIRQSRWRGGWTAGTYAAGDYVAFTLAGEKRWYRRVTAGTDAATVADQPPTNRAWADVDGDELLAVQRLEAIAAAVAASADIAALRAQSLGLTPASGDRGYALRRAKADETYEYVIPPMTWRGEWAAGTTYYTGDAVSHTERLWILAGAGHIAAGLAGAANAPGAVSAWVALTDTDSHTASWAEAGNTDLIPAGKISGAYYGEWDDTSSTQDFGVGDRVAHNAYQYVCLTAHRKGASAPDIDYQHWDAIDAYYGPWTDFWYPSGVFVSHLSRLWWASADVARGDPAPGAAADTKWWRVGAGSPPITWGEAWADGVYWAGTMVTDDDRLFVSRRDIVAGNPRPSTDADETYWLACDSDSGIAPGAFYQHLKSEIVAGGGITLAPDDDDHTLSISADLVRPIAPPVVGSFWGRAPRQADDSASPLRLRAVDSNDLRTPPAESYGYVYRKRSQDNIVAQNGVDMNISNNFDHPYPSNPDGYESSRPGIVYDRNDGPPYSNQWNMNGVDWTSENAGQARPREFDLTIRLVPANDRLYTSDEHVEVWLRNAGGDNRVQVTRLTTSRTFHFGGGHQTPFVATWRITLSGAPRSGEHDWFSVHIQPNTGSSQITAQTYDDWSLAYSLPHLGRNVAQEYSLGDGAGHEVSGPADMYILDLAVHGTDHQGISTSPGETDKAEVELVDYSGELNDKPRAMRAVRDLRDVVIRLRSTQAPTFNHPDPVRLELWTELDGLYDPAPVQDFDLAAATAYDISLHTGPLLTGQRFYLVSRQAGAHHANIIGHDVNAATLGQPILSWDPTIDTTRPSTEQVIAGLLSTHIVEYSGAHRSAGDFSLGYIAELPPPSRWEHLRIESNGVQSAVVVPADLLIPTSAADPAATHPSLGPVSVREGGVSSGQIVHERTVSIWRDGPVDSGSYMIRLYDRATQMTDAWIDRVELEYHI